MAKNGRDDTGRTDVASSPCLAGEMSEINPAYFGYLDKSEILNLLNLLLECERAGARGVMDLSHKVAGEDAREMLRDIAGDEARFCAMLARHIDRLGETPSQAVGAFYDKLQAAGSVAAQLALLDRGQDWVAAKLREALPKISAELLRNDLHEMLVVHERNIERARALNATPATGG